MNLFVALLHDQMKDKTGNTICTSITTIDVHDIARSCSTYGVTSLFVAHPSEAQRELAHNLKSHWENGFGAKYNSNRKQALQKVRIVSSLEEAIADIEKQTGLLPSIIATSAQDGKDRHSYEMITDKLANSHEPFLLMFGTGWGMSNQLLGRANYFLKPINGPTDYNHLSVRSACAITLDRLLGMRS